MTPACPPAEALRRLGLDGMGSTEFGQIEAHVEGCPRCRERLERLARLDSTDTPLGPGGSDEPEPPRVPGYALGAVLGRGGGGVVYEAVQLAIGRRVAVKVLAGGPAVDARARARWLREARAVGRIRHPNVVRLHEAGEHDGRLYLVLDLVPGGSLRDRALGPIPPRDAAAIVETVARAVEAVHRQGVLHLDIKPSNILLDGPPESGWAEAAPLLSDFGIALEDEVDAEAAPTASLGARGTPAFMAPEQVSGRRGEIGPAADVFALGATLYALLAGRPPFQAASPIETLDLVRSRDPAPPRALVPGLPRDLETVCLKCLEKDPARRYASAAALADDLRRWLDGFPIRARPVSGRERAARWCRRNPAQAALAAALAASVLAALVGLTALWRRAEAQRGRADAALARALRGESAAGRAVADLIELLRLTVLSPEAHPSDRAGESLDHALGLADTLRQAPGLGVGQAVAVARIERRLADALTRKGRYREADRLLLDAAELTDPGPSPREADARLAIEHAEVRLQRAALSRYPVEDESVDADVVEAEFRGAAAALEGRGGDPRALTPISNLHHAWRAQAEVRASAGDREAAWRAGEAADALLDRVRREAPGDPTPDLLAALGHPESGPEVDAAILAALGRFGGAGSTPRPLARALADRIAREAFEAGAGDAAAHPDPADAARAVLAALDARAQAFGAGLPAVLDAVDPLSNLGIGQATLLRRHGRIGDARWSVAWQLAFGRALAERAPESPAPRLIRSRAFEQDAKIGWAVGDIEAVERALRESVAEASAALALDSEDEYVRVHAAGLREKYLRLLAAEPEE